MQRQVTPKILKPIHEIPGPKDIKGQSDVKGDLAHFQRAIHQEYGSLVRFKLDTDTQAVSTTVAAILKSCSRIFDKPEPLFRFLEPIIGNLLFLPIDYNMRLRKFIIEEFSPRLVQQNISVLIKQFDQQMDAWLLESTTTGGILKIQERMKALAMRMTVTLA